MPRPAAAPVKPAMSAKESMPARQTENVRPAQVKTEPNPPAQEQNIKAESTPVRQPVSRPYDFGAAKIPVQKPVLPVTKKEEPVRMPEESIKEPAAVTAAQKLPPQPFETRTFGQMVKESTEFYQADLGTKVQDAQQLNLFEEKILTPKAVARYELIGQVFDTYWIAVYENKMILIDQHAAHEKVKYEALMKRFKEGDVVSQNLMPPMIVTLTPMEEAVLKQYDEYFSKAGFEIEEFGGNSYALRAVPCDLYGNLEQTLLQEILEDLGGDQRPGTPAAIAERIATMACKAAVKGNHRLNREEMQSLLEQLLTLDNPYHCPHGRPTMITMTRQELEKKFKRII